MSSMKRFLETKAEELAKKVGEANGLSLFEAEVIAMHVVVNGPEEGDPVWDSKLVHDFLKEMKK